MDLASLLLAEETLPQNRRRGLLGRSAGHSKGSILLAPEPFEPATQKAVDFLFGRHVLKSDIELAFSAVLDGVFYRAKLGSPYKKGGVEGTTMRGFPAISFGGTIQANYQSVGTFRRTYVREKQGLMAYMDLVKLDDEVPLGVGSAMMRNTMRFDLASKVTRVELLAAWVGRYVWASLGWTWADAEIQVEKRQELTRFLQRAIDDKEQRFSVGATGAELARYKSASEGAAGLAKLATDAAYDTAALRLYDAGGAPVLTTCPAQEDHGKRRSIPACSTGKAFLLDPRTNEWSGVLRLDQRDRGFSICREKLGF